MSKYVEESCCPKLLLTSSSLLETRKATHLGQACGIVDHTSHLTYTDSGIVVRCSSAESSIHDTQKATEKFRGRHGCE